MTHLPMGRTGVKVSALGLGTNSFGGRAERAAAVAILHRAIDAGITLIDTANIYTATASETIIGEGLRGRRHQVLLATKAGMQTGEGPNDAGASRYHLIRELEGSLRRLQTESIDLYQIHDWDPATPLEETLRTLDDMVRSGKVRYVGASNFAAWQLTKALWTSDRRGFVRFETVQPSYSLADRAVERELVPLCRDQGIGLIAYFPLGGGILTGKYRRGQDPPRGSRAVIQPQFAKRLNDQNLRLAEEVAALAGEAHCTPAQLALAWLLRQPAVCSAIAGATSVAQLEENLGALEVKLSDEVLARLDEISRPFV
ncbi:MAG: aldo/keto reductase [Bacillati bacterium ANGP1]|uniref:Aldo/keto reductase n=1 Tax=Candidatus Segetimicrobium genomatis TaxID=2569760 RepID=A0A537JDJ9_9BACT|nr:MAG: aldo/keto reductase [Terrabacteria group bacterium ANGP1]